MAFRFTTSGESHGKALIALVEGLPAGIPVTAEQIDHELWRRMQGYGRGARMKIEQDRIEWISGVRSGETLGSPVGMLIHNRDWVHWEDVMAAEGEPGSLRRRRVVRPRPGHADLVGLLKYQRRDARDILERASARETTARVACGALARRFLEELGVEVGSHLVELGGVVANPPAELPLPLNAASDQAMLRTLDPAADARMVALVDQAKKAGDTLGGIMEVVVRGLPVGLGSHISWDRKLDGRLAQALMSIQAVKGVEIGLGFQAARLPGSEVHDPIAADAEFGIRKGGFRRLGNHAGGLEGGMTTGEALVLRVAMKPISTLMSPLRTVNLTTGEEANAQSERSDVTAVPAMGVIAEAMTALVLAEAVLEKFGGDSLGEVRQRVDQWYQQLPEQVAGLRLAPEEGEG